MPDVQRTHYAREILAHAKGVLTNVSAHTEEPPPFFFKIRIKTNSEKNVTPELFFLTFLIRSNQVQITLHAKNQHPRSSLSMRKGIRCFDFGI
jgi:hypothetical protein